ncbi:uncharacterized protein LOC123880658 isoform X4 [Maniola jurtina]|uniref:uncharacterized protein LOC123880658 isoform X4 n=1 Tax=Maniola jurtina TaxID=191418 RepID=UPI001E68930F|nr:uncharacterized protein LOC123880658 isoform X4 [Maniola jurtina]
MYWQGTCSTSEDCSDSEVEIFGSEEETIDRNSADDKQKKFSSLSTFNISKNADEDDSIDIFLPLNQEALKENRNLCPNENENLENGLKRANSQELETNKRILLACSGTSDSSGTGRRLWRTERRKLPRKSPSLSGSVEDNNAVVQNGQSPKNNVTYTREDDVDQDVVFWKLSYFKEMKKTEELTKLINQTKGEEQQGEHSRVPPEQPTSAQNSNANESALTPESIENIPETSQVPPRPQPHPPKQTGTVKMKFIKKNAEVQIHVNADPSQLGPIMARVAQLFQMEPEQ